MKVLHRIILIMGMILLTAQLAWSAPLAGHVILTKGNVTATAEDGSNRALKRRSEIFNGDVIRTGPAGSVQIRFIDKALMTIKANSEMNMEAYLLAQEGNAEQNEQVLMSLVKGGFRTITGTIGKGDKSAYKVNTPAASIGIRGTNYEVQQEADGGFVMGVYSGGIQVENEAGSIDLGEGADFNFTRVKPKSPPKGLLAPPPSLGENSATEQSDEEENSEEGADDNNDEGNDDGESDSDSAENDGGDNDGGDDNSGIFAGTDNNTGDVENEVTNAIDSKLSETIEETKDEFVDAGGADQLILDALVEAGILQIGQTFTDLHPDLQALIEAWLANPTTINDLITSIKETYDQIANTTFDFSDPYKDIVADASNPFTDKTIISDQEYGLAETGKLALLAIPVNSPSNYAGDSPSIQTLEAQLVSPEQISSTFVAEDYSGINTTSIRLSFKLLDINTGVADRYDIEIIFDGSIASTTAMVNHINALLAEASYQINDQPATGSITDVSFSYNATDDRFEFKPTTDSTHFLTEMEIQFSDDPAQATSTALLMDQLGADTTSSDNFWYADAGLDMVIGNGSIDGDGRPILVLKDSDTYTDENNNQVTEERIEVVTKIAADVTTSSLASFSACVADASNPTCDIQVDSVTAASNIRWGAWLAEPGQGIQIAEFHVNDNTTNIDNEEQVLAFWLAAERADINQLTGTANFSTDSDCLKFGQCIGFSDDGIVQSMTANFDVDFNRGTITNGNLTLQTSDNPTIGLLGNTPGDVASTWSVNFSGQLSSENGTNKPEFQTQTLSGTVTDSAGTHGSIIGNIGGIFVKPGDTFAGGYNLGTADGSNKHAAGVFTMDKQ